MKLSVGFEVPGFVIGPKVKVKVCVGINDELARLLIVTLLSSKFTNTVGALILVPDALINVIDAGSFTDCGNVISSHPEEVSLSFSTIENTYNVLAFTSKLAGPTEPYRVD